MSYNVSMKCQHEGCQNDGRACFLDAWDDEPNGQYCGEHAHLYGFCRICGLFWGGIESFEFLHPGLCDNCHDQIEADYGEPEGDEWDCVDWNEDIEE